VRSGVRHHLQGARIFGEFRWPAPGLRVIVDELTARDRDIPPVLLGDLNATPYDEDMRVLTGKVPEVGVGLVLNDAWEMLHGPEGGWTFDLRDNPWLQGTPPGGRYRIDHVLPALSPRIPSKLACRRRRASA
jgi:endonuclease/exonuclease/phosphatase family metal-dependent hydrolase